MSENLTSYVRITNHRSDGFVEFNFSLQDPALYIEMILPDAAFNEFCATNHAQLLTEEQAEAVDRQELIWLYGTSDLSEIPDSRS